MNNQTEKDKAIATGDSKGAPAEKKADGAPGQEAAVAQFKENSLIEQLQQMKQEASELERQEEEKRKHIAMLAAGKGKKA